MSLFRTMLLILIMFALVTPSCSPQQGADLVLKNGKVATVDQDFSIQQALAISGNRIVFVGSNDEAAAYIGTSTEVIDLQGKLVLPGLHRLLCPALLY